MSYYKPKKGERDGTPTITVPRTMSQMTYFNVPLAEMLENKGMERIVVDVDKKERVIQIRTPQEDERGYKVLRTGRRGWGITPKLRKVLPAGRYRMDMDGRRKTLNFVKV